MKKLFACSCWVLLLVVAVAAYQLVSVPSAMAADTGNSTLPLLFAAGFINLRNYFTAATIVRYLEELGPVVPTVVMDTVFTNRPQEAGPVISEDIIQQSIHALPLSVRGGSYFNVPGATGARNGYEPYPIKPSIGINGVDLNNLRLIQGNKANMEAWARLKTDVLRKMVRATAEALCADALDGIIEYPVALDGGGWDTYYIKYGDILTVTGHKLWTAADVKISDVFDLCMEQKKQMNRKGCGGAIEFWAGPSAYSALFKLAEKSTTTAKIRVEVTDQAINIGGFMIKLRAEEYRNPQTKAFTPVIPDNTLKAIAMDAGHIMPYAALDDLDSNLEAMPLFIKPVRDNDGNQSLKGESKPLPVVNPNGICDAEVTA